VFKFFLSPAYSINRLISSNVIRNLNKGLKTLDVGCGEATISEVFFSEGSYTGIDVENRISSEKKKRISFDLYDGFELPYPDGSFEQVLCMEVFEHVANLELMLREIYRVLKPGGRIIVTVPFMWPEHEMPQDFRRYTANGLANLMCQQGFKLVELKKIGGAAPSTLWCIEAREAVSKLIGKTAGYLLMIPFVLFVNISAFTPVSSKSGNYSNVMFVGEK
jgi:SAM-dependent methyltransferase